MDDVYKLFSDYTEMFDKSAGVPWNGFRSEEVEREYYEALRECIHTKTPLTEEREIYFDPNLSLPPEYIQSDEPI